MAAKIALPSIDNDQRNFFLGAVGIRDDGVLVSAKNGASEFSTSVENYQLIPTAHAEGRLLRKLGKNGIVFVARVAKKDGGLRIAMPCDMCANLLKAAKVQKVFFTINDSQYGCWDIKKDIHRVFNV
jgi:cytidine deaminase